MLSATEGMVAGSLVPHQKAFDETSREARLLIACYSYAAT
jgi:hypothetical protein